MDINKTKKLGLISLGCGKNLIDSENLIGTLVAKKGMEMTNDLEEADVLLINTCGFIGDAKEESIEAILEGTELKKEKQAKGSDLKVIAAGCLATRYPKELLHEIEGLDAVIGTGDIHKIEEVIDEIYASDAQKSNKVESFDFLPSAQTDRILTTPSHLAYLKLAEGCNRKCSYCIIPKLRGPLRSRPIDDIVEEAKRLAETGVRELNLLAQETTEYGLDFENTKMLPQLLKELVKIEGIKWIRLYYMFPNSITDELLEVIASEEKICNYFDVPIQHISSHILKDMRRAGNNKQIKMVLEKIRSLVPDATIRTSLIVGFPGETEEDYEELKTFVKEFKFDYAGVFKYSREEDTKAFEMDNQVSEEIKERRYAELSNIQAKIAEEKNRKYLGTEINVMIDGISMESEFMLEGRAMSQAYDIDGKILTTDGSAKNGEIVRVRIEQNFEYDMLGPIAENEDGTRNPELEEQEKLNDIMKI